MNACMAPQTQTLEPNKQKMQREKHETLAHTQRHTESCLLNRSIAD
jgi:hypothetical protein